MRSVRAVWGAMIGLLVAACGTLPPPAIRAPYLTMEAGDSKMLAAFQRKETVLAGKCASKNTCDHVFFTRALAALYESREAAAHYFEKVIAVAPKGQLAASSRLWLQLLQSGEVSPEPSWVRSVLSGPAIAQRHFVLSQTVERAVRDLLDRELTIQQLRALQDIEAQSVETLQRELLEQERKAESLSARRETSRMSADPGMVQQLQRQLAERDKKIEELAGQLEALKRIDQEMREKTRPIKLPSNVLSPHPSESPKP